VIEPRNPAPVVARPIALLAFALVASSCGLFWESLVGEPIPLWVINSTGVDGVSVKLDGKVVASELKSYGEEAPGMAQRVSLKEGQHRVEALAANGSVIDAADLKVGPKTRGFLFAPKHGPDACFAIVRKAYGDSKRSGGQLLFPGTTLWEMPFSIDRWFEPSPDQLAVQSGSTGAHDDAVRMLPCDQGTLVYPLPPLQ